jgi:hypothetical protein
MGNHPLNDANDASELLDASLFLADVPNYENLGGV